MCFRCLALTQRSYRAGAWFFTALPGLFAIGGPLIIAIELRRFGMTVALDAAAILAGVFALTAGTSYFLWNFGAKLR